MIAIDALIHELQYAGRRELIYGLHVHVGVDDPDRAIHVVNALRAHLCELVALSANSPFWRGAPTGYASCRHMIFSAFPRSGPPPEFASFAEYATVIEQLVDSGSLEDYTRTWWDVRPHPRFGTVEVRVMDAVTRVDDAIALAAYVQSLVHHHADGARAPLSSGHRRGEQVACRALRAGRDRERCRRARPGAPARRDRAHARRDRAVGLRARLRARADRRRADPAQRQRSRPAARDVRRDR